jgi:hypothetical protein
MGPREYVERKDQHGRAYFSTLVHWRHAKGPAHCLLQAVFLPENRLKIFLAELRTCSPWRGIYCDTEGAANAAWGALEEHFGDLSHLDVEWVFRGGQFSSYDVGTPSRTSRYVLTRGADRKWRYKSFDNAPLTAEEKAELMKLTNVPEVEDDLEKLPKMPPLDPRER